MGQKWSKIQQNWGKNHKIALFSIHKPIESPKPLVIGLKTCNLLQTILKHTYLQENWGLGSHYGSKMVKNSAKLGQKSQNRSIFNTWVHRIPETFSNWFRNLQPTSNNPENPYLQENWGLGSHYRQKMVKNLAKLG